MSVSYDDNLGEVYRNEKEPSVEETQSEFDRLVECYSDPKELENFFHESVVMYLVSDHQDESWLAKNELVSEFAYAILKKFREAKK